MNIRILLNIIVLFFKKPIWKIGDSLVMWNERAEIINIYKDYKEYQLIFYKVDSCNYSLSEDLLLHYNKIRERK